MAVNDTLARSSSMSVFVVDEPVLWNLRYPASGQLFQHIVTGRGFAGPEGNAGGVQPVS